MIIYLSPIIRIQVFACNYEYLKTHWNFVRKNVSRIIADKRNQTENKYIYFVFVNVEALYFNCYKSTLLSSFKRNRHKYIQYLKQLMILRL